MGCIGQYFPSSFSIAAAFDYISFSNINVEIVGFPAFFFWVNNFLEHHNIFISLVQEGMDSQLYFQPMWVSVTCQSEYFGGTI